MLLGCSGIGEKVVVYYFQESAHYTPGHLAYMHACTVSEWLQLEIRVSPFSGAGLAVDDELMLNVLRCHETY